MNELTIVAESAVHPGRKLLQARDGAGYLQLGHDATPLPLSSADFKRLRGMSHYRRQRPARGMSFAPREEYDLAD
ncbi:MAG TPA: hypothetical protein VFI42_11495 [Thermomicrobiaceae bacterium]|nr:hypothetical protein [Thermomicrobiaceae bacterium]